MLHLVLPNVKYKKSFLEDFLPYVGKSGIQYESWGKYWNKKMPRKDFSGFVKFIRSQRSGKNLPDGYVPHTIFWLTDGNNFFGLLQLRHRLTPYLRKIGGHIGYEITPKYRGKGYGKLILKLGLKKAKQLGIKNALLTVDATNFRSKRVIESNGGKYEGQSPQGKGKPKKMRYWIKT